MAIVSELTACDIPRLRAFILEAWRLAGPSALGWTGATDENISEIASENYLQGFIGNADLKVFISKIRENVVGFCALRKIDDRSVELAGIVVRQDQLGRGVGTDLFEAAKKQAVRSGFATMLVKTESINDRALSFYRSKGFVEGEHVVEEIRGIYVNLTVLKLDLPEAQK
ncbi:GNAT family N-acetyltransferase [Candidatus Bathyarchaeota archaeon]|nr:GNAT family N-acetyltransferase [Candidatus Bathyarchaeota archaeon]